MSDESAAVTVVLEPWTGPWPEGDPDANFKTDMALYARVDPLATLSTLSRNLDVPVGALARYVLAKWATSGSGALLELGPQAARRLQEFVTEAEETGTDDARLAAYHALRAYISWLNVPLDQPDVY